MSGFSLCLSFLRPHLNLRCSIPVSAQLMLEILVWYIFGCYSLGLFEVGMQGIRQMKLLISVIDNFNIYHKFYWLTVNILHLVLLFYFR
jgi:hypothetical protein